MCHNLFDIHISGTDAARPLPKVDICLYLSEWSDDFEPNDSIKGSQGSVWIKTLTVSPSPETRHQAQHTYPLALGRKNADHEPVELLVNENLLRLGSAQGKVMYSKKDKCLINACAKFLVSMMDQPERRGANCLMAGNSIQHQQFGYLAPWSQFKEVSPPCDDCWKKLLDFESEWTCSDCPYCTNWAYHRNHPLLKYRPPADLYFPWLRDMATGELLEDQLLSPIILSYPNLIAAVQLTHDWYVRGQWTPPGSGKGLPQVVLYPHKSSG
jgi:hypothetical protein